MTRHTHDTAAPSPTFIWDTILALRAQRDAIENATEQITAQLDALGERSGLQAGIDAGYGWAAEDAAEEIVELINASPRTPTADEIAAIIRKAAASTFVADSPLIAKAREITARIGEVEGMPDDDCDAAMEAAHAALQELEAQIPRPPRSFADLVALAQVAFAGGEMRPDGTLAEAEMDDIFEGPAARLVEAVLQFAGTQR